MAASDFELTSIFTFSRVTLAVAFSPALMMTVFSVFPLLVMTGFGSSTGAAPWVTVWIVPVALTVISPLSRYHVSAKTKLGIKAPSSTRDKSRVVSFFINIINIPPYAERGACLVHYKYNKQKPGIARLFSILEILTKWGEYFCAILRKCQIPLLFDTIIYDSSLITLNFRVAGRRETLREQWAQRDCACSGGNLPPLAARPFVVHLNL